VFATKTFERVVAAWIVVMLVAVAAIVLSGAVNLPFWDEWEWADYVIAAHHNAVTLSQLWAQHNEHRMFFPRLVVIVLDKLHGWDTIDETLLNVTMLAGIVWIAATMIRRTIPRARQLVALAAIATLLCTLRQEENLVWGFQIAWFMVALGLYAVAALVGRPVRGPRRIAAAIAIGVVVSYSMSSGLLVWPLGIIAILLAGGIRDPDALFDAGAFAAAGAAVSALYFRGYQTPGGHPPLTFGLTHPTAFVEYVAAYVGSVFGGRPFTVAETAVIGAVGIAAFAVLAVRRWRDPLAAPWIALGCVSLLGAVITAAGRVGFGTDQALSSRYVTLSVGVWVGLAALLAQARYAPFPLRRIVLAGAAVAAAVLFVHANLIGFDDQRTFKERLAGAYFSLVDVAEPSDGPIGIVFPDPGFVSARLPLLRAVRDGPFLGRSAPAP
jgi:hypothetical protein